MYALLNISWAFTEEGLEEVLKNILMRVKEESVKCGLKL